jgi:hypothetical protein
MKKFEYLNTKDQRESFLEISKFCPVFLISNFCGRDRTNVSVITIIVNVCPLCVCVCVRELSWELISVNLSIPVYINNEISSTSIYFSTNQQKNSTRKKKKQIFLATGRKYWWLITCVLLFLPPPHYYLTHFEKKRKRWPSQLNYHIFRMSELSSHSFPKE